MKHAYVSVHSAVISAESMYECVTMHYIKLYGQQDVCRPVGFRRPSTLCCLLVRWCRLSPL